MAQQWGPYTASNAQFGMASRLRVFRCRVGMHSLGRQGDSISENHLTIYLLVGAGTCARLDMRPMDGNNTGALVLSTHDYTLSQRIIRHEDIPAAACPPAFDPDRSATVIAQGPTVGDFVRCITSRGLQYFRFVFVEGHSMGCHHWVLVVTMRDAETLLIAK